MKNITLLVVVLFSLSGFGPSVEYHFAYGLNLYDNQSRFESNQVSPFDQITEKQIWTQFEADMAAAWMIIEDYQNEKPGPWDKADLAPLRSRLHRSTYVDLVLYDWMQGKSKLTFDQIKSQFMGEMAQKLSQCSDASGIVDMNQCAIPIELFYSSERARQNLMIARLKDSENFSYYYKKFTIDAHEQMSHAVQLMPNFEKTKENIVNHFAIKGLGIEAERWQDMASVGIENWTTGLEAYLKFPWDSQQFDSWIRWHVYTAGRDGNWVEQYYFEQEANASTFQGPCYGKTHNLVIVDKFGQAFAIYQDATGCSYPD